MIIWFFILFLFVINMCICSVYSRIRKKHDTQRMNNKLNNQVNVEGKEEKISWKKKVFRKIDNILYGMCRYMSIIIGYIPSHTFRRMILKMFFCMDVNKHAIIHGGCEIRSPWNIKVGNSVIGVGSILDGRNGIEIEDNVVLATGVWIWTEQHDANDPYFRCLDKGGKVIVKERAWIGNRVVILPKITIEEGTVVAAGAVVTHDCKPFTMYAGIPAKEIHERNNDLRYCDVTKSVWPFY